MNESEQAGSGNGKTEGSGGLPIKPPVQTGVGPGPRFGSAGMPVEKSKDFKAAARRVFRRMGDERLRLVVVVALCLVSVFLTAIGPAILGRATDVIVDGLLARRDGSGGIDFDELRRVLMAALVAFAGAGVLGYMNSFILAGVVQRTMYRLREDVEEKLHRLPLGYVDRLPRGDLLSRVTNDIDNLSQSLQQTLSQLLTNLLTIIGVTVMMLVISPILAIVAVITIPLSMVLIKRIAGMAKGRFIAQWMHTGSLNAQVEEAFTGHSLVKVFGRQNEVEGRFRQENDKLHDASFGAAFLSGAIQPAMMFLGNLNYVAIAVVGGFRVAAGAITIGDIQAFIQYSRQFSQPLTMLASMANMLQSGIASAERIFELLDADEQVPEVEGDLQKPVRGRVAFEDVAFSYLPGTPLIDDLDLVAEAGSTVAIVGATGAGKTTLVNLIMRFYELDGGRITLDRVDIADIGRRELRSNIGMVLQDTWLFNGTIRENIRYGRPTATDDEVLAAARACYVDRFVHSLPDGYDTVIADDGENISAGERQLITIARAFLAEPTILILDEATSSVDTRTEVLIQRAMAALRSERTSFVIAHRLSTIRDADTILVMDRGRIVEQGNHAELLAQGGAYAALHHAQFEAPAAEVG